MAKHAAEPQEDQSTKQTVVGCLIFVIIVILAFGAISSCISGGSKDSEETAAQEATEKPSSDEAAQTQSDNLTGESTSAADSAAQEAADQSNPDETMQMLNDNLTGDIGSNDRLNAIDKLAKANSGNLSPAKTQEAVRWIKSNYPAYYNSAEMMEQTMYYGYLLDYAYDDSKTESELGMDTYQAIKYVYRGNETVDDSATQSNLLQIKKSLDKLSGTY